MQIRTGLFYEVILPLTAVFCLSGVNAFAQCADSSVAQAVEATRGGQFAQPEGFIMPQRGLASGTAIVASGAGN
jgi:hypothetical protein